MKIIIRALAVAGALALGLTGPGFAHQETAGNLKIGHPWIRQAEAGTSTYACIIEITNEGDEPETLLGATVDGAGTGVLYRIIEKDGKFTSEPVEHGLAIKPHGSIELSPSTYQFRFKNVTKTLTEDSMIGGTLVFEKLHSVPIHYMVEPDDTAPKEEADHDAHEHHGM
ncbi:MAG TPA: copper chaperone PCu(A)C [Methylocella sp.]|nr:copper chaperone PCu(A)C [Methylocella sp.]